ncbi:MAG: DNA polymerase I [Bacilli bacterium]|nr:DNA polymerase I [Bacilli bacterium]
MGKLIVIDGNSLLFRAYFATAYPGVEIMRNQEGIPTNAIFAFSNMINKIILSLKDGESIFVAFDAGKNNFRKETLESYKANRKPAPEELVQQFPIVREFLRALNIYQFEQEGYEGDDIAGTIATLAAKQGYQVDIYTSDRDFIQLVDERVTVQIIKKGLSDVVPMTPDMVKETFGFSPKQIIDYKGLRGDSSDNLPGIPGVGDKTAIKLINEYGNFDNIINNASSISGKVGEMIRENKEIGKLSRDLAIIKTDVDLPFGVDDLAYKGYDFQILSEFCQKYGLKQFISKVTPKWKAQNQNSIKIEVKKLDTFKNVKLSQNIGIAVDFDSDDYQNSQILGIAISSEQENYYINIDNAIKDSYLKEILANKEYKKYCYDYKAIKVGLNNINIEVNGLEFDLLIASYLIDSSVKNNPNLVMNLYGIDIEDDDDNISLLTQESVEKTAKMAYFSKFLQNKVINELKNLSSYELYEKLEIPLVETLTKMEIEGFPLDGNMLDSFGNQYKQKLKSLEQEIFEMANEKFNIASPKQLGDVLYNHLGLPAPNKKLSTDVDALKELAKSYPIVSKVLEYRKYYKLVTTYIDGLKPHIFKDGKIHATFNQALTQTGRLSSSNPNLQNISVRDEEGKNIRKAFYYKDNAYEILSLDYSQIELRVLAHMANCESLKNVFLSGEDIHTATAKKIFNLSSEPTGLQRRKAKAVNFGIIYGISDWGLADQLEISNKEAKEIIQSFYISFPEVSTFFQKIVNDAINDGYVSTLYGRRRYLRELHDSNYQVREFAKRAAMNAPIQGTAADLIKIAMNNVQKMLDEKHYKTKMVLQIHDELIFKVPLEEKEMVFKDIKNTMEHAVELSVPLVVDGGFGKDWYNAK